MLYYIPNLSATMQLALGVPSGWAGGASLCGPGSEGLACRPCALAMTAASQTVGKGLWVSHVQPSLWTFRVG